MAHLYSNIEALYSDNFSDTVMSGFFREGHQRGLFCSEIRVPLLAHERRGGSWKCIGIELVSHRGCGCRFEDSPRSLYSARTGAAPPPLSITHIACFCATPAAPILCLPNIHRTVLATLLKKNNVYVFECAYFYNLLRWEDNICVCKLESKYLAFIWTWREKIMNKSRNRSCS